MFGMGKSQPDATRVSFRLPDQAAEALTRQAEATGTSHGVCARDIVVSALLSEGEEQLEMQIVKAELGEIRSDLATLQKLRDDLASAVHVLLVHAGQLDPDAARAWVEETLVDH